MKLNIEFLPDGTARSLDDPPGFMDGERITIRASRIVPVNPVKRLAFQLLRCLFGERGKVAAWTRHWRGPWRCRIIGSTQTFTHPSRRVCLDWERQKLED